VSADNFIGVYRDLRQADNPEYVVCHGFMSPLCEAESQEFKHHYPDGYWGEVIDTYKDEATAYEAAFAALREESIVEYGVIELETRTA
jgi:hypothetical protein